MVRYWSVCFINSRPKYCLVIRGNQPFLIPALKLHCTHTKTAALPTCCCWPAGHNQVKNKINIFDRSVRLKYMKIQICIILVYFSLLQSCHFIKHNVLTTSTCYIFYSINNIFYSPIKVLSS